MNDDLSSLSSPLRCLPRPGVRACTCVEPYVQWRDMITGYCYAQLHDAVLCKNKNKSASGGGEPQSEEQRADARGGGDEAASSAAAGHGGDAGGTEDAFIAWFSKLVMRNEPTFAHQDYPGTVFIGRDTVYDVYKVFNVEEAPGAPHFQSWLDLLQRAAEDKNLLALDVEELDDFVPMEVLTEFAEAAMEGYCSANVHV